MVDGVELALSGRLDGRTAAETREALHHAIDSGHGDLIAHVDRLEIFDATGLGVIVGAHRRAVNAQRRFVLVGVGARQLRLLRAARLHRLLCVEPVLAGW